MKHNVISPDWDQHYMALAFVTSFRSKDQYMQHGAVITTLDNKILGTGYNGTASCLSHSLVPEDRDARRPWQIHSEENAILNCAPHQGPKKMYVTGKPCNNCLLRCLQFNIVEFVCANRFSSVILNEETDKMFDTIVKDSKRHVRFIDFDYEALISNLQTLRK